MFDSAKPLIPETSATPHPCSPWRAYTDTADQLDSVWQGGLSHLTFGLKPAGLTETYVAWLAHLSLCPGRLLYLFVFPTVHVEDQFSEGAQDSCFRSPLWNEWPRHHYVHVFHWAQAWWDRATLDVPGLPPVHTRSVNFAAHQWLNAFSPANFMLTNPENLQAVIQLGGRNLVLGFAHFQEDWHRRLAGQRPVGMDAFTPRRNGRRNTV